MEPEKTAMQKQNTTNTIEADEIMKFIISCLIELIILGASLDK